MRVRLSNKKARVIAAFTLSLIAATFSLHTQTPGAVGNGHDFTLGRVRIGVPAADAAQTIPYEINFQGRLMDSSGNIMADGDYNMKFSLWTAASGGSELWEEDYTGANKVPLENGLFSVQLGSLTSLASVNFATYPIYIQVELPTPATATGNSPSWTEGAMTPRQQLESAPYAFNSQELDGLQASSFAQTGANNTYTGTQTINTTSTGAFLLQNAGASTTLFAADTTDNVVGIGAAPSSGGAILQVSGSISSTGTISVGSNTGLSSTSLTIGGVQVCTSAGCTGGGGGGGGGGGIQNGTVIQTANFAIQSASSGDVTGVLQAASGQTADVFDVQNSSGGNLLSVSAAGVLAASGNINTTGIYEVGGTQISSANLSDGSSLAKLNANNVFTASGNGTSTVGNIFQNGTNSTTALQIQNAAGTSNLFDADTADTRIGIGTAAPAYTLDVQGVSGNGTINAATALYVGGIQVCTSLGCTAAANGSNYIQNQTGSAQSAGFNISGNGTIGGNATVSGTSLLSGALTVNGSGNGTNVGALFQNTTNSTTAFEIQNAAGTGNLFVADTTDGKIGIGQAPSSSGSTLQVSGSINASVIVSVGSAVQLNTNSNASGHLDKNTVVGTGGVSAGDVVILNSSAQAVDTTTARDTRVYGVAGSTVAATGNDEIAIGGDTTVNATGPINIGDQLVTSTTSGRVVADDSATSGILGTALSALASGNGTVNVAVRPVGGASNPIFSPQTDSTTAFQIQNAARSTQLFDADTTNTRIGINTNAPQYTLDVNGTVNTSSQYDVGGVAICASTGCTASSTSAILNGTSLQANANFDIQSASAGSIGGVIRAATSQTADLFEIQSSSGGILDKFGGNGSLSVTPNSGQTGANLIQTGVGTLQGLIVRGAGSQSADLLDVQNSAGTNVFSVGSTGNILAQAQSNSTTAFQIQNQAGTSNLFVADTTDGIIGVDEAPTVGGGTLQVAGSLSTTGQITSNVGYLINTNATSSGNIQKNAVVGTGGVNANDVVVMNSSAQVVDTTTARDTRVYGVTTSTVSASNTAHIEILGNAVVNATAASTPINVGDQLVTSTTSGDVMSDNAATTGIIGIALTALASGTGTVSVELRPVGGVSNPIFSPQTDSTTAFQIQNAARSTQLFDADTTNTRIGINTNAPAYTLDVHGDINTTGIYRVNGTQIASSNLSDSANLAKLNGTGPQIFTGNNEFTGSGNSVNAAGSGTLFQNATNSTNAFEIQNAAGTDNLFVADTTDGLIGIGAPPITTNTPILQVTGAASLTTYLNLTSALTNTGQIRKGASAGAGGVNTNDVVVMNSSAQVVDTTTARDPRVYGIASFAQPTQGVNVSIDIAGDATVNATTNSGANPINVGDQLVTSTTSGDVMSDNSATTGILGTALTALASGTGTVNVAVNVVHGENNPIFSPQTDATTAFQVQNAARSSTVLDADTTNTRIGINTNAPAYTLDVHGDINTTGIYRVNGTQIASSNLSDSANLAKLNATQTFTGNNTFTGSGNGSTVAGSGTLFQNATNSTNAFEIQNAAGTSNLLVVDTTDGVVGIGQVPAAGGNLLQVGGSVAVNGASLALDTTSTSSGYIDHPAIAGTGGVTAHDVIVMNSSAQVVDTTTARDPRVYGVAANTAAASAIDQVAVSGNYLVNATTNSGANPINIGDQLVTSTTSGDVMSDNSATTGIIGIALTALASGTGTVSVELDQVHGQSNPIFSPQSNATTAFQIQNAARSTTVFDADTTNTRIGIGTNAPAYTLDVAGDVNTSGVYRINGTQICSSSGCTASSGSAILNGTSTQANANFNIQSASASSVTANIQGATSQTANIFQVQDQVSGTPTTVFSVGNTGNTLVQPSTNSATAFQVQNSAGTSNLLVADTTDNILSVGAAPNTGNGAILQVTGTVSTTGSLILNNSATSAGQIRKASIVGTGGVTQNDVVVLNSSAQVVDTTTARDIRVYGVAPGTVAATGTTNVIIAGDAVVSATTNSGANPINVGDQLVTSTTSGDVMSDNSATTGILGIALTALASGTGTVNVAINPVNGQNNPIFSPQTNSTTAFQIQNAARSSTVFDADTTNLAVGIDGGSTTAGYALNVTGSINASTAIYVGGVQICSSTGCTASASSAIQNGTGLQTNANFNIQSRGVGNATGTIEALGSQTADLLDFDNSSGTILTSFTVGGALQGGNGSGSNSAGTALAINGGQGTGNAAGGNITFGVAKAGSSGSSLNSEATVATISGANGATTFENSNNSTTGFSVQNASGNYIFDVDTANSRIGIGTGTPTQSLSLTGGDSFAQYLSNVTAAPTLTPGTSGSLATNTYYYKITALDGAGGETNIGLSGEGSVAVTGPNGSVAISWTAVTGAASYRIYRGTSSGGENVYYTSTTNSFTDTGAASTSGSGQTSVTGYVNKLSASGNNYIDSGNLGIGTATPTAALTDAGNALFQNTSNSTTAFQIQNAANSTTLFNADTTNTKVSVTGQLAVTGGINTAGLNVPAAPTISNIGTAGGTNYTYAVSALNANGGSTLISPTTTTATGNATLNGSNYNQITWTSVPGASSYNVYRTASSGTPSTTGLIGNVLATSTLTFSDTGIAGGAATPTIDNSGQIDATGTALFQNAANSTKAFQIQNAAGTGNLFVADTTDGKIGIGLVPTSGSSTLSVSGGASVTTNFILGTTSNSVGNLQKQATAGTGGVNANDVVVMNSSTQVVDTTTARDTRVYGVALSTASASSTVDIAIAGNTTVNATAVATPINVGDQLVASTTSGDVMSDNTATTGIVGTALTALASGTGTVSIAVNVVSGEFNPTFQNNIDSTTAFQIQNAAGNSNLFDADTTDTRIGIGTNTPNYTLDVNGSINAATALYVGGVEVCTSAGCTGGGGGGGGSSGINNSNTLQGAANFAIQSANAAYVGAVIEGAASQSADLLDLRNSGGTNVFSVGATGNTLVQPSTNSTTAFQVQNAAGTSNLFVADTTDGLIGVDTTPSAGAAALQVNGNISTNSALTLNNTSTSNGAIAKAVTVGTGGVTAHDVVAMNSSAQVVDTTTARDTRVYGVAANTASASASDNIYIYGNTTVNATTNSGANPIHVGDQLVTSTTSGDVMADNTATTGILGTALTALASGTGTVSVAINPVHGQSTPDFTPTTDSTTAFQIQNASRGTTLFDADTTNTAIGIAGASTTAGYALNVTGSVNASTALYVGGNLVCNNTGCTTGSGSGYYIQNGTSLQANANFAFQSALATNVGGVIEGAASQSADLLDFRNSSAVTLSGITAAGALQGGNGSGTNIAGTTLAVNGGQGTGTGVGGNITFSVAKAGTTGSTLNSLTVVETLSGTNGSALFQNSANSTTAFQIQNASGSSDVLDADTTNGRIGIGTGAPTQQLELSGNGNIATLLAPPGAPTLSAGTSGSLATNTYYYKITALDAAGGETSLTNSGEASVGVTGPNGSVQVSWTAIQGAVSYRIYRGTSSGGENTYYSSTTNSFTDTGAAGTSGTGPSGGATGYVNKITANGNSWFDGGNVGIGTATPTATLDVAGNALFQNTTNSTTAFQIQNQTGSSNLFVADTTDGLIGIGAAPGSAGSVLQVTGNISTTSSLVLNASGTGSGSLVKNSIVGTGGVTADDVVVMNSSSQVVDTTTARDSRVYGVAQKTLSNGSTVQVALSGNATVNATAVSTPINVGDQLVTSTTTGDVMSDNTATTGIVGTALSALASGTGTVAVELGVVHGQSTPDFTPTTDSTTAFQVQNAGRTTTPFDVDTTNTRVGIGTNAPGNLLSVGALTTASSSSRLAISTGGTTNSGIVVQDVASQSGGYFLQAQNSSGTNLASIDYQGNLTVQAATINGTLTVNGHIVTGNPSGATTTVVVNAAGSGTGGSPGASATIAGNDTSGTVTITTGAGGTTNAGDMADITFGSAYSTAPHVVLTPDNAVTSKLQYYRSSTTSTFSIDAGTAPTPNQVYQFDYEIEQ